METTAHNLDEEQIALFLSGDFYSLFNNLRLNLPQHRMDTYKNPSNADMDMIRTIQYLNDSKTKKNRAECWRLDDLIKIYPNAFPGFESMPSADKIRFLCDTAKIPEGHFLFQKSASAKSLFGDYDIFVSRLGACNVIKALIQKHNLFKAEISKPLFIKKTKNEDKHNAIEFNYEMALAVASYYFLSPDDDYNSLISMAWAWVRGARLKSLHKNATDDLKNLGWKVYGKEMNFHELEEFKNKFIYDIMFGHGFQEKYEQHLQDIGFKLVKTESKPRKLRKSETKLDLSKLEEFKSDFANKVLFENGFKEEYEQHLKGLGISPKTRPSYYKWRRGLAETAPKYPGGFFAPHVAFLLARAVSVFCDFVDSQPMPAKNRARYLQTLAVRFFTVMRGALGDYLSDAPIFCDHHHDLDDELVAGYKSMITARHNKDKPRNERYWSEFCLFDEEEKACLGFRKRAEITVKKLHDEYRTNPNMELAQKIAAAEQEILDENMAIYGFNFGHFVQPREVLNQMGEFEPRPVFGPEIINNEFIRIAKPAPTYQFGIFDDSKIPRGIPYSITEYVDKDGTIKKRTNPDVNGNLESVNPPIAKPQKMKKNGEISLVKENFQQCNFLFESDKLPLGKQLEQAKRLVSLGVINRVVFSGGKSYHMICTVKHTPKNDDERNWLFHWLIKKYDIRVIDTACKNNNRLTRRAGYYRLFEDGTQTLQELLHSNNVIIETDWREIYKFEILRETNELRTWDGPFNSDIGRMFENYNKKHSWNPINVDAVIKNEKGERNTNFVRMLGVCKRLGIAYASLCDWVLTRNSNMMEIINETKNLSY